MSGHPMSRAERVVLARRAIATLQAGTELVYNDTTPVALLLTLTKPEMKALGALLLVANACNERSSSGPAWREWDLARARLARGAVTLDERQDPPPPTGGSSDAIRTATHSHFVAGDVESIIGDLRWIVTCADVASENTPQVRPTHNSLMDATAAIIDTARKIQALLTRRHAQFQSVDSLPSFGGVLGTAGGEDR